MSELQWRNEMRKLGGPVDPACDLWPDIALRIGAQRSRRSRIPRIGFAIAATALIACVTALIAQRTLPQMSSPLAVHEPARAIEFGNGAEIPQTALDWTTPTDPVLAAAAHDIDSSSVALQQALEQRPDAVFLVGILNRTNSERMRLLHQSPYAG